MSDAGARTLREIYERQVVERGFRADPAQLAIVDRLETLRARLIAGRHSRAASRGNSHFGLGGRLLRSIGRRGAPAAEKGLYLWGPVGRGKTWLMDLFFQSLPFPERRRRHFHRFMHDVHAQLKSLQNVEAPLEAVAERLAAQVRVLCFDELFVTDIADAMILGGLLRGLFHRGVTLVATSNVPPRDLYRDGLQRARFLPAIELIERQVEVVAAGGDRDYRLRQLTQAGTYLPSGDANTAARLRTLFAELSDHAEASDGTVAIEGRPIPVVLESEAAVWFEFDALCAGPRSQDDYIEIARNYQSIVLSDVPVMGTLRENEARRFIALIDELYDRCVKLVISAAAPPAQLYRGERLTLEFQRTASRLTEMQSEEYLAREHRG
ncbi:MAG TPA: cell division protein ZapE [Steroidobacteraceae bacterium]|jgi:cell division protein ZapE|nr:cell division protein ZapE [Steroidobacteraceae bacterium]